MKPNYITRYKIVATNLATGATQESEPYPESRLADVEKAVQNLNAAYLGSGILHHRIKTE